MSRTAVVTGVSRRQGIGFAVSRRLAAGGFAVVVHGWPGADEDPARGGVAVLAAELGAAGHVEADLADPAAPGAVVRAAAETLGHVDVLVVNHALGRLGSLEEVTAEDIDAHLHVNVRGSLLLVQAFAAQHDGRPGGRIVLLTSGQHLGPMASELAYAVSKGALHQATRTLAEALADRSITVNAVNPGPTDTGWAAGLDPGLAMPFGRFGEPDDAARLIAWLCSEDGRWVTGQVIDSEGGFRRWAS